MKISRVTSEEGVRKELRHTGSASKPTMGENCPLKISAEIDLKLKIHSRDKTDDSESSPRPGSNGPDEAHSDEKPSSSNGSPLLENELAKPDVTPSGVPRVDENGEGGVTAEAARSDDRDPEPMDTSEVESGVSSAASPSGDSDGDSSSSSSSPAADKPAVTTGASGGETRDKSPTDRVPNGSIVEPELLSEPVPEQSLEKSAPNSAPASNQNSHGDDVEVDGDDEDDDDDDEGALVVDEGDSSPEVQEKDPKEETVASVPAAERPASLKEEKKASPAPETKAHPEIIGSKKRAISPAASSVTKKLKVENVSAQEKATNGSNLSGSATINAIANISASAVTEALCSTDDAASPPPERLPNVEDMNLLDRMLLNVRKDIRNLDQQVKEKEREWNLLLHRKKKMEEYYLRLRRKREVETLETTGALPSSSVGSTASSTSVPPNVTPIAVLGTATGISMTSKALPGDKVENTVSIISSGMSGGKVKTVTQEPSLMAPRAMTITPDMIYGGNGKAKPGASGSMVSVASQIQMQNNSKSSSSTSSSTSLSNARARSNWRPPPNTVASSSANATTASVLSSVAKAAASTQADVLQMYTELVRQQQQLQQQNSYQQAEKLQQALTGGGSRANFQSQPSQLQQALGLGSSPAEAAAAAAVVAANASRQRANSSRVNAASQESTLASILEASRRQQVADRSSSKSKASGVNQANQAENFKSKESARFVSVLQKSKPKESAKSTEGHPTCHGCKQRMAQFVCAGCNSQWYCSRECQISDWDEHAEQCNA